MKIPEALRYDQYQSTLGHAHIPLSVIQQRFVNATVYCIVSNWLIDIKTKEKEKKKAKNNLKVHRSALNINHSPCLIPLNSITFFLLMTFCDGISYWLARQHFAQTKNRWARFQRSVRLPAWRWKQEKRVLLINDTGSHSDIFLSEKIRYCIYTSLTG